MENQGFLTAAKAIKDTVDVYNFDLVEREASQRIHFSEISVIVYSGYYNKLPKTK